MDFNLKNTELLLISSEYESAFKNCEITFIVPILKNID